MKKTTSARMGLQLFMLPLFIFYFFSTGSLNAQSPGDWQYAVSAGGTNADAGKGITVDAAGNSYVVGYFDATTTFYGPVSVTMTTTGGTDIFLAKYDPTGNVLWAVRAGGTSTDQGLGVSVDNAGNSYITGYFSDTAIFYDTVHTVQLISKGGYDIFIAKYDPSGNILWAKQAGGTGSEYGYKIKVDGTGNSYLTGFFPNDTLNFYGATDIALTSNGSNDIFIAKFDPNGDVLWAKHAGGSGNDFGYSIAIDGVGDSYVTGTFSNTSYFYGATYDSLISQGGNDIFIAKYDPSGNILWVRQGGSVFTDQGLDVKVDPSGSNCYVTGNSSNGCIFFGPPSNIVLPSNGLSDIFVAAYTSAGNLRWVKHAGGSSSDFANGIDYNAASNHLSITGYFSTTSTFYGSPDIVLTSAGSADIYVAEYDTSGIAMCAQRAGGTGFDRGWDVGNNGSGKTYIAGEFTGTAAFPSSPAAITLTSAGATTSDILIGSWLSSCTITTGIEPSPDAAFEVQLYPNPASNVITLSAKGNSANKEIKFAIYDVFGKQINSKTMNRLNLNSSISIDVTDLSKGIYFIRLENGTSQVEQKFIVE